MLYSINIGLAKVFHSVFVDVDVPRILLLQMFLLVFLRYYENEIVSLVCLVSVSYIKAERFNLWQA